MYLCWRPNKIEERYLRLIAGMTVDCLMGNGTQNRKAFTNNLRVCANQLDDLMGSVEAPSKDAQGELVTRKGDGP
jgi:hypothetical protein